MEDSEFCDTLKENLLGVFDDLCAARGLRVGTNDAIDVREARWKITAIVDKIIRSSNNERNRSAIDAIEQVHSDFNDLGGYVDRDSLSNDGQDSWATLEESVSALFERIECRKPVAGEKTDQALAVDPNVAERQHVQMSIQTSGDIADLVRRQREHMKLTQANIADAAAVDRGLIVEIERNKPTAQIGKVLDVLSALGISLTASVD